MTTRKITDAQNIPASDIDDSDVVPIVHVAGANAAAKNRKATVSALKEKVGGGDLPSAPANQSEQKDYNLRVPASTGDPSWVEDTGGGGGGTNPRGAGDGLELDGNNLDVKADGATIAVSSNGIKIADSVPRDRGDWAANTPYVVGDTVSNSGTIYRCNTANSDAVFTASKWDDLSTDNDTTYTNAQIKAKYLANSDTNNFDDAAATKLTGIAAGAQENPRHVVVFRAEDGNPDGLSAGEIAFIKADNSQWQTGSTNDIAAISIKPALFGLTQNPAVDTPSGVDMSYLDDKADNLSSSLYTFQGLNSDASGIIAARKFVLQAETTIKNQDGSYALQNITIIEGLSNTWGTGVNWQVAGGDIGPAYAPELLGKVPQNKVADSDEWVKRTELEGHEDDKYASYNNAFIGNPYRSGNWCLFTGTAAPTDARAIRQPDIANGSGVVAFGRLRTDADPNRLQWDVVPNAAAYPNGRVIHAIVIGSNPGHVTITLTSAGTLVGTGDAAYVWATATWTEDGDVKPDGIDYWRISSEYPSEIDIRIPSTDILGAPWVRTDAINVTPELVEAIQGDNETVQLANSYRVDVSNVDYYISFSVSGSLNICTIRLPSSAANSADDTNLTRLIKDRAWISIGDYTIDVTTNATRSIIGTSLTFVFNFEVVSGTQPTGSGTVKPFVFGEDIHRGEVARQAFRQETPSIAGKGGSSGQIWSYGSNDEDAGWADPSGGLPDQNGHGGQYLKTNGTDADWAQGTLINEWVSSTSTNTVNLSVADTDSIPMGTFNESGIIDTENVSGFGNVFKTGKLRSLGFIYHVDATQGVAVQIRYSDTKPTGSTDAKNYGTLVRQVNDGTTDTTETVYDVPANRYFWFNWSGGGSRTASSRKLQMRAAYEAAETGDITGVTAGDGLTGGGDSGNVSVAVNPGDGVELVNDEVTIDLDGSTLSKSSAGLKLADGVPRDRGDWVSGTSYVVGDTVKNSSVVYRCNTANSDATFTASKWDDLSTDNDTAFKVSEVSDTLTTLADDDYFVVSDESATGDPNKKITKANLKSDLDIGELSSEGVRTATVSYDSTGVDSAGEIRKQGSEWQFYPASGEDWTKDLRVGASVDISQSGSIYSRFRITDSYRSGSAYHFSGTYTESGTFADGTDNTTIETLGQLVEWDDTVDSLAETGSDGKVATGKAVKEWSRIQRRTSSLNASTLAAQDRFLVMDASASNTDKYILKSELDKEFKFDVHDSIDHPLTTLADNDRIPISDESESGDPMYYVQLSTLKTFFQRTAAQLRTAIGNATSSVAGLMSSTDKGKLDAFPSVPANQSTAKKYELNVPASSGAATFVEAASGGGSAPNVKVGRRASYIASNTTMKDFVSVTITPSTSSKKILLTAIGGNWSSLGGNAITVEITDSNNATLTRAIYESNSSSFDSGTASLACSDSPATTSAVTYKVRAKHAGSSAGFHAESIFELCLRAEEYD